MSSFLIFNVNAIKVTLNDATTENKRVCVEQLSSGGAKRKGTKGSRNLGSALQDSIQHILIAISHIRCGPSTLNPRFGSAIQTV